MTKDVPPELGAKSYTCPFCGAVSHQTWFKTFAHRYPNKDDAPFMPDGMPVGVAQEIQEYVQKLWSRKIFPEYHQYGDSSGAELCNLHVNLCYSCNQWCVWVADKLVFPPIPFEIKPNEEMPDDPKADFIEAGTIIDLSPRGAAALLRLCIQKLVIHLGEPGDNLNADIASLVRKGLNPRIQQALDLVRVVGNHSVHPVSLIFATIGRRPSSCFPW